MNLSKFEAIMLSVFVSVMVLIGIICNEVYARRIERGRMFKPEEWSMVWSNGVSCPVAIAREVNGRLQELAVDWKALPCTNNVANIIITNMFATNPIVIAVEAPAEDGYRIVSDGKQFQVEQWFDVWGWEGEFWKTKYPSKAKAEARIVELKKRAAQWAIDQENEKKFKPVPR